jgi:SAM-dependent methyltransferase
VDRQQPTAKLQPAELGAALRRAGLVPRALAAWAGTDRIAAVPHRVPALATTEPVPAAVALALFVAGTELSIDRCRGLPLDALIAAGLLERAGASVRASLAIVPVGPSLVACDRLDAGDAEDLVAWPDDSSHHLAGAIPAGRRARWLDLGCGSAFAQLARPALASELGAIDRNPRAVELARLGAALSGVAHLAIEQADVAGPHAPADLVTCNAPLPHGAARAIWRRADPGFFAALWRVVPATLAGDGLAVIHASRDAVPDVLPGERVIVSYREGPDAEAVLWWRPAAGDRLVTAIRALTVERPHLEARDRDEAVLASLRGA